MSALVKKEIRLLLPAWIVAMLLAIVPGVLFIILAQSNRQDEYVVYDSPLAFFVQLLFVFGVLFLGITSFGQEFNSGSFAIFLSQPMERRRIWLVKIATLAIAFVSVWLTAILFTSWQFDVMGWFSWTHSSAYSESLKSAALEFLGLSTLVTFSGGLWTTLLLRQTTGAFWFTLLTPLAIILGIISMLQDRIADGQHIDINAIIIVALILYSIVGFLLAWMLFMRAQDLQWSGGEISFPWRKKISETRTTSIPSRPRHWLVALVRKETQLHQSSFIIAILVLALHLTSFCLRKFHAHIENPNLQSALEAIWILWLLMPLLIGATAIAEERRIGIAEQQLCLPVSRRTQLFFKFCVALVLSLFFGGFIPWLVEGAGAVTNWIFLIAAGIFFISFCASSLARTTLQAVGLAVVFAVAIYVAFLWSHNFLGGPKSGFELLMLYLSAPILSLVSICLIFWNFKRQHQNWKLWTVNISSILAAIVFSYFLASVIYFRAWELVMTLEPRGPIRIYDPTQVKFETSLEYGIIVPGNGIYSLTPDHRLWINPSAYYKIPDSKNSKGSSTAVFTPGRCHGQFVGGSNWVDFEVNSYAAIAIQSDGTLWTIQSKAIPFRLGQTPSAAFVLSQMGHDTNWSRAARGQDGFLLLKNDGSVWRWGTRIYICHKGNANPEIKQDTASLPVRVTDRTNWTGLYSAGAWPYARNSDGNNWMLLGKRLAQETNMDNQWSTLKFDPSLAYLEIKTNGELWYCSSVALHYSRKIELGQGMKWRVATFSQIGLMPVITAIRSDGTLWNFPFTWSGDPSHKYSPIPYQVSTRSDWVAVTSGFALASDGSIWTWGQSSKYPWLAPPRGPASMGNIFQATETTP